MKVLCKKNYQYDDIIFIKNNWYKILKGYETHDHNNNVNSYFIQSKKNYGIRFVLSNFVSKYNDYDNLDFNEYFYTLQEIRKIKLDKLKII